MSRVFDVVLGVFREPGLVADLHNRELPENLPLVIRLAAGEGAALQSALDTTGETAETLVEASVFFLQQVLFAPGADAYRVLGAHSDAPQKRLHENYRWLMKWLHPDRNQDGWEAVYADRVNAAWQELKTPDRRGKYDHRLPSTQMLAPMTAATMRSAVPVVPTPGGPLLSGSMVRRLPTLVLGALGLVAMAMIGITYWAQSTTYREFSQHRRHGGVPPEATAVSPDSVPLETPDPAVVTAAASAAGEALRADFEAIDVAYGDPALPNSAPSAPISDTTASVEPPAVPAVTAPAPEPGMVAAFGPAPTISAAKPADVPIRVPPVAAAPAEPIAPVPDNGLELSAVSIAAAQVAPDVAPPAAAATRLPAPRLASVIHAPAVSLPEPRESAAAPQLPDKLPVPALPATERSLGLPSVRSPLATVDARQVSPVATAQSRPDASSKPDAAVAVAAGPADLSRPAAFLAAPLEEPTPATGVREAVAEAALVAPAVAEASPRMVPAQHDAEALVQEFVSAYAAGDLARFDRLFSSESPEAAALIQMRSRFGTTEMRYLEIEGIGWQPEAEQGRVRARYRDTYVPNGRRKAVTESGVIEWIIRVDAGDARIASVAQNEGES
jgi:hypothetical protein